MTTADSARDRWLALYVLCAGFLMIVLDMTVVNVALPAIQEDLGFSQSGLAWVVNGYLIAFGGLLLLSGRLGDLLGRKDVFMVRNGDLPRRLARLRLRAEPGAPGRRAVHPGHRRRSHVGRDPGDDRDDVLRAEGAGEGARRLRVRRLGRRLDRPPCRRHPDRGDQLALDLLHQPADRHRNRARGQQARRSRQGARLRQGHGHPRRGAHHIRR